MASTTRGDQPQARGGRQASDQQAAPRHHHGRVVSHTAGRMRVRLRQEHRDDGVLAHVQQDLLRQPGVKAVTTNARTGSVLVNYDRHRLSREDMLAYLYDVGVIARDLTGADELPEDFDAPEGGDSGSGEVAPHSSTATSLMDALTDLDRRLSDLTGGKLDIKVLFPLGLGALAVRQIATTGLGLAEVPGYVLLWYTFDSFYKLHQRRTAHVLESAAERVMDSHHRSNPEHAEAANHPADDVMIVDEGKPGG